MHSEHFVCPYLLAGADLHQYNETQSTAQELLIPQLRSFLKILAVNYFFLNNQTDHSYLCIYHLRSNNLRHEYILFHPLQILYRATHVQALISKILIRFSVMPLLKSGAYQLRLRLALLPILFQLFLLHPRTRFQPV